MNGQTGAREVKERRAGRGPGPIQIRPSVTAHKRKMPMYISSYYYFGPNSFVFRVFISFFFFSFFLAFFLVILKIPMPPIKRDQRNVRMACKNIYFRKQKKKKR